MNAAVKSRELTLARSSTFFFCDECDATALLELAGYEKSNFKNLGDVYELLVRGRESILHQGVSAS